jgi:hypothetical protein
MLKVGDRVLVGEKLGETFSLAFPRGGTYSPRLRYKQAGTVTGIARPTGRDHQTTVYVKLDDGKQAAFPADWVKPV